MTVPLDGFWQKGRHTCLNGIFRATSGNTAKVTDVALLSKHCTCPGKLKGEHKVVRQTTVEQVMA